MINLTAQTPSDRLTLHTVIIMLGGGNYARIKDVTIYARIKTVTMYTEITASWVLAKMPFIVFTFTVPASIVLIFLFYLRTS